MVKITFAGPTPEEANAESLKLCEEFGYQWIKDKLKEVFPDAKLRWMKANYANDLIVTFNGYTLRVEIGRDKQWSLNNESEDNKNDILLHFISSVEQHMLKQKEMRKIRWQFKMVNYDNERVFKVRWPRSAIYGKHWPPTNRDFLELIINDLAPEIRKGKDEGEILYENNQNNRT